MSDAAAAPAGGAIHDVARRQMGFEAAKKSALVAALLNVVLPGAGYMYCGNPILGCLALVVCAFLILGTGGLAWLLIAPVMIIDGVLCAGRANRKLAEKFGA